MSATPVLSSAVRSVTVDIETDFDDKAMFGLGDNTAAPLETRLKITVDADAPDETLRALVDDLLEMDPWFLALRERQVVKTSLVTGP